MKVRKTCEVGGAVLEMTHVSSPSIGQESKTLTLNGTNVPLEEVKELVAWLQTEVLMSSMTVVINPWGDLRPKNYVNTPMKEPVSVQSFPAVPLETRTTGRFPSEIPVIESAVRPGEIDPFADRKVDPDARHKYKALTSIPKVDLRDVEQGQGFVEQPFKVKL